MIFEKTDFEGLFVIKPKIFGDSRGYFFESFNQNNFEKNGINCYFIQDNQSLSNKNIVRGLHFQNPPFAQDKLVRVINGKVLDVVVDIRKDSKTYGKHFSIELSEENKAMLFIPKGFAHGFASLEDNTIFSYKCSNFYNIESESGLMWNDSHFNIDWQVENPILSEKDMNYNSFENFISKF